MTAAVDGKCTRCGEAGLPGRRCTTDRCASHSPPLFFIPDAEYQLYQSMVGFKRNERIGTMLDEYLLIAEIGSGGFGCVFLALQTPVMMRVALKVMNQIDQTDAVARSMLQRFEKEAISLARLSHPNIVKLIKYSQSADQPYIVMEFVDSGATLREFIAARNGPIPPSEVWPIADQILNALQFAHQKQIVHRDIKPENIMLQNVSGYQHFVKVLDFGLAKFFEQTHKTKLRVGTPSYLALEQLRQENVGPWTDLYALGIVIFEMLTGELPFPGDNLEQILKRKADPLFDPLFKFQRMPEILRAFIRQAIHRDVEGRYRSVESFRAAMADVAGRLGSVDSLGLERTGLLPARDDSVESQAVTRAHVDSAEPPMRRRGVRPPVIIILTLTLLILLGGVTLLLKRKSAATDRKPAPPPTKPVPTAAPPSDTPLTSKKPGPTIRDVNPRPPRVDPKIPLPTPKAIVDARTPMADVLDAPSDVPVETPDVGNQGGSDAQQQREHPDIVAPGPGNKPLEHSGRKRLIGRWRIVRYVGNKSEGDPTGAELTFQQNGSFAVTNLGRKRNRILGAWTWEREGVLTIMEPGVVPRQLTVTFDNDRVTLKNKQMTMIMRRLTP